MASETNDIRAQQRESWNKFSAGWKKWDELALDFLRPAGTAMLESVLWNENLNVLDIASGTGEPGLTAAGIVKKGKVIGTDLAEQMVAIAKQNAKARGLHNFETSVCSAESLPFDDQDFDAVLCRFGFMFFPSIDSATREMVRVLKHGGSVAAAVWGVPEKNDWATTIMKVINQNVEMPPTGPDTPGLFRCAKPGFMSAHFEQAGLKNIEEKDVSFAFDVDSIDVYWNFITEVAAPVVAGLNKADAAGKAKIKAEAYEAAKAFERGGRYIFPACATIITGERA
jgi:ubiquinone/menaquinone biosynthesis C-methylase UbiE